MEEFRAEYNTTTMIAPIKWKVPLERNGVLRGYLLNISVLDFESRKYSYEISANLTEFTHQVNVLCRKYSVRISAFTSIGPGPAVNLTFTALAPGLLIHVF